MASTACSIEPMAVSTTTATLALNPEPSSDSFVNSPIPSMRGIFRSVTTIAGFQATAFSQPSMPSRAVSVRYPHPEINSASPMSAFGSSSTMRTFRGFAIHTPSSNKLVGAVLWRGCTYGPQIRSTIRLPNIETAVGALFSLQAAPLSIRIPCASPFKRGTFSDPSRRTFRREATPHGKDTIAKWHSASLRCMPISPWPS